MKCEIEKLDGFTPVASSEASQITGGWGPIATWAAKKVFGAVFKKGVFKAWGDAQCGRGNWTGSPIGPICHAR